MREELREEWIKVREETFEWYDKKIESFTEAADLAREHGDLTVVIVMTRYAEILADVRRALTILTDPEDPNFEDDMEKLERRMPSPGDVIPFRKKDE